MFNIVQNKKLNPIYAKLKLKLDIIKKKILFTMYHFFFLLMDLVL